jgi:hypothetical protein
MSILLAMFFFACLSFLCFVAQYTLSLIIKTEPSIAAGQSWLSPPRLAWAVAIVAIVTISGYAVYAVLVIYLVVSSTLMYVFPPTPF